MVATNFHVEKEAEDGYGNFKAGIIPISNTKKYN